MPEAEIGTESGLELVDRRSNTSAVATDEPRPAQAEPAPAESTGEPSDAESRCWSRTRRRAAPPPRRRCRRANRLRRAEGRPRPRRRRLPRSGRRRPRPRPGDQGRSGKEPARRSRRLRRHRLCGHPAGAAGEDPTRLARVRQSLETRPPQGPPPPQAPPRPHPADALLAQLAYVVVNEAGASVYSTSQVGRDELPDADATLRSGISIGRRLQDPLAELVKIEPQNIGVGLYQHDINPKHLKESLETVISSCVNFVGVDLNTASVPLLRHVSGLNQLTARRIVDYRKEHGPFSAREQLQQIEGIGPATYTQAAGFLKIHDGEQPLDRTWIHPESYGVATRLLEKLGYAPDVVRDKEKLTELRAKLAEVNVGELSRELETGEFTLRDIIDALARPERDPRDDLPKPIFKKGILKIEDLAAGMELKGTVLNVVDFGAFVDIGLKDSGLVHISQLANRYVKSPHDMVSVGDVVTVWVMGVDHERKRVSLTMVKPGTERQRGPQSGGRRGGGPGRRAARGTARPGPARRRTSPPRPITSALTAPPVGAPSVAVLPERPLAGTTATAPGPGGPRSADPRSQAPPARRTAPAGISRWHRHDQGGSGPPPGRGGPRGPFPGPNAGRPPRLDRGPADRTQNRPPRRPAAPPPPLSKEALEGNVPLRTFGQLKQLWEARTDEPDDSMPESGCRPSPTPQPPRLRTKPQRRRPTLPIGRHPRPGRR